MDALSLQPRSVQFGIYRDGDNNLDSNQCNVLGQAVAVSKHDGAVGFSVQDTTARNGEALHTNSYQIAGGRVQGVQVGKAHDMADPKNLAAFVAQTLDDAQRSGAKQSWIDLVDHGGGDGGGLEADSKHALMSMPGIAAAIAEGERIHAAAHPEDAGRSIDGVVANQCLMSTMGFADALSKVGVKYLAASPETMISPGTPSTVAASIADNVNDPSAMAHGVVNDVMKADYRIDGMPYAPAAAYDVLDLAPQKIGAAEHAIKKLDDALVQAAHHGERTAIRSDVAREDGMVRFPGSDGLPWHADRPAIATYGRIAADARLSAEVRADALGAESAVKNLVLAHAESSAYAPFGGSDYRDAAGPTVHLPTSRSQIDPWAPKVSETANAFYHATDEDQLAGVLA